ncbi:34334_t:CDS:1, partial [Racocetra persica]
MTQSDSNKKETANLMWFRENENTNYRRPIMFPDNDRHITEYTQI